MKIRTGGAAILALLYSGLSIAYFAVADKAFYARDILNCGIALPMPAPYAVLTGFYILIMYYLMGKDRSAILPLIAMAAILPLAYLLIEMKIGMDLLKPFRGARSIYGYYSCAYFFAVISLFAMLCGASARKLLKAGIDAAVFHIPVFAYLLFCLMVLFSAGYRAYAYYALILFLAFLSHDAPSRMLIKAKDVFAPFFKNERLFLAVLFAASFLLRYFWGTRLLGLVGEKFAMASDDGITYNQYAALLARGQLIPKGEVYGLSGFLYWYFLAAVYKIFGLFNYKALIVIQSFIGSSMPVFVYFIGKIIFKSGVVPVLAGAITALNLGLVFLSCSITMEAIYIPLVWLAMAATLYFLSEGKLDYKKTFLMGGLFGLAYNARPPELLFFPFILAVIIYFYMKNTDMPRNIAHTVIALFIGFAVVASIQYLVNYVYYGEYPRLQVAAAASFHVGLAEGSFTDANKILGGMGFSPFENPGMSASVFMHHPIKVASLIAEGFFVRLFALYFVPNFGVFDPFVLVNPASGYFFRFAVYVTALICVFILIGMAGAFVKKDNLWGAIALFSFLAYMSARAALCYVLNSRYRGVLLPAFILFFAYGAAVFYGKARDGYRTRLGRC